MRWEQLFADLEAQSEALAVRERAGEVDELARAELSRVALVDRLSPSVERRSPCGPREMCGFSAL